jgi:hypothetical protein
VIWDRDHIEVIGALTSPRWTIVCESTAYVAHSLQALLSAHPAFYPFFTVDIPWSHPVNPVGDAN